MSDRDKTLKGKDTKSITVMEWIFLYINVQPTRLISRKECITLVTFYVLYITLFVTLYSTHSILHLFMLHSLLHMLHFMLHCYIAIILYTLLFSHNTTHTNTQMNKIRSEAPIKKKVSYVKLQKVIYNYCYNCCCPIGFSRNCPYPPCGGYTLFKIVTLWISA